MSYQAKYGALLDDIANEADRMAMSYFRGGAMGAERKRDGTVVTQADKRVEQMAIAREKSSGLPMDVVGEERSAGAHAPAGRRSSQQPRDGRILAAHAGGGRCDRVRRGLDFEAVGPLAAWNHRGRGGRQINHR